jgi:hypothetical protein
VRTDRRAQVIHAGLNGGDRREHIHLCKWTETACAVPVLLQQPMACAVIRMLVAILAPILGMLVLPVVLAGALVGPGIRIGGQLVALPLGFPGPLTDRAGTETLGLDPGIRQHEPSAMGTAHGAAHGFLLREAGYRKKWLSREE